MNTPNKLTLIRVILIPFFVLFLMTDLLPASQLWALAVFAIASFTDFLDGYLARRDQLVTNFGKLIGPLADKLLVTAALICFVEIGLAPAWVVIIIISREFLVTSIRLVAAGEGKVIAADKSGKYRNCHPDGLGLLRHPFAVSGRADGAAFIPLGAPLRFDGRCGDPHRLQRDALCIGQPGVLRPVKIPLNFLSLCDKIATKAVDIRFIPSQRESGQPLRHILGK